MDVFLNQKIASASCIYQGEVVKLVKVTELVEVVEATEATESQFYQIPYLCQAQKLNIIILKKLINFFGEQYDRLESYWEGDVNHKLLGTSIVMAFLLSLLIIQMNRWGFLPQAIAQYISHNYFVAIEFAFVVLLFFEVLSLVFVLPHSVAGALAKQFEILSLILLRNSFKEFGEIPDISNLIHMQDVGLHIISDAFGALIIFVGIYFIRSTSKHYRITDDDDEQFRFVQLKKLISVILLAIFIGLMIQDAWLFLNHENTFKFFETFYIVLIFSDILIVLVSLRYSYKYIVLFRNSGFALATVLLRVALTAPVYYNVAIGLMAVLFVLILNIFYGKIIVKQLYR
ncbi:MAG: hypothetical protein DSY76_06775 [Bacteroidetes bacterium]|nr:MAG: hypothetical protein DSY76_06775 [Bacteroidota bacterium]